MLFGLVVGIISNAFDSNTSEKSLLSGALLGALGGGFGGFFIGKIIENQTSHVSFALLFLAVTTSILFVVMKRTVSSF